MKRMYITLMLLCSGVWYFPAFSSTATVCPCITKDGGECCCASRGTPCNCAEIYGKNGAVPADCPCIKTTVKIAPRNPMVEVSYGELFDKVTILEIKARQIQDEQKRKNVLTELDILHNVVTKIFEQNSAVASELQAFKDELATINWDLWQVEDAIRVKEKEQKFDAEFIVLARNVYKYNKKRLDAKTKISKLLHSHIIEEKLYAGN